MLNLPVMTIPLIPRMSILLLAIKNVLHKPINYQIALTNFKTIYIQS
jgi:hypothetical protein